jgi:hypothetical protein
MPFSSSPVYVGNGDQVEIRYPTPSTWDTSVTIQVQIGTGSDPNGVTLGTRTPVSKPTAFVFTDNQGSTSSTATLPGDFVNTFQKNTTYYSNTITVAGLDLRVPIRLSSSASGPLGTYPNSSSSAFSINGGPFLTAATSSVSFTGTTTSGSNAITSVSSTTGLAVGRYVSSANISGEILSINGTTVTLTNKATATGTSVAMTGLYTVQNNDVIRLRITTENWYTTNTNVTLTISDDYWGAGNTVTDTWSITTRAQDQLINTLTSLTFIDYVDVPATEFSSYKTQNIAITGIDNDVVLRATATGNGQISKDGITWSQSLTQLKLGDTLYTRLAIGSTYTTKTTGVFTVFAVGGDTAVIGSQTYTNNSAGTYGSGTFAVTQTIGSATDNWQVWTEVDRYPNAFTLAPIFTPTDSLPLATVTSGGSGYVQGNTYSTTNSTGSGSGLTVKVNVNAGVVTAVEVVERGSGYQIDDVLNIVGGTTLAQIKLIQYRLVNVSSTNTLNNAEIGLTYYANFTVGGLGTEYPTATYSDLEAPLSPSYLSGLLPISTTSTNNATVQVACNVVQGSATIRKNGSGSWVQQLYVQNGDVVTVKLGASTLYNTSLSSTVQMIGPPAGGPIANPTAGPTTPTFADKSSTITIKTRQARTDPYPFKAQNVFNASVGNQYIRAVPIDGLDLATDAAIVSQTAGSNAQISLDGVTYSNSIATVPASTTLIYVRATASISPNAVNSITYRVGNTSDTFIIQTKRSDYGYTVFNGDSSLDYFDFLLPEYANSFDFFIAGAGGGNGGDDAPNSFGGRGGNGNLFVGTATIPDAAWPDPTQKYVRVYSPDKGLNGISFSKGAVGGNGGFGYATGGKGGNAAPGEYSGSGGGGGGAAAIALTNGTLIALAGGGGGGGGAGDDTVIQKPSQNGNNSGNGATKTVLTGLNLTGLAGQNNTTAGGGGGGAGGGFGVAGTINTSLVDEFGGTIATTDLDANGGGGGGIYYNSTWVTASTTVTPSNSGAGSNRAGYVVLGYPPQDVTPDPFVFTPIVGATPAVEYVSEYVQITGISGAIPIQISSNALTNQVRVCTASNGTGCGAWGSSAVVRNNQYIQLKMTVGAAYFTDYTMTVDVGDSSNYWIVSTGAPPDTVPNSFNIPAKLNQPINTQIESDIVVVTGLNSAVPITASNGALISICNGTTCDAYAASPRSISNNQGFKLKLLSSPSYSTTVNSSVSVGGSSAVSWDITTIVQPDNTPTGFLFFTLSNQNLSTTVTSNSATIQGIDNSITFSVTNGATLIVNDVDLGVSSTTVSIFDVVKLKYTTTNIVGDSKTFNVTAGTYTTTWTVTNAGVFGTAPTPFLFPTVTASAANTATNSNSVTIAGLGTTVGAYSLNGAKLSKNGGAFNVYTSAVPLLVTNGDTLRVQLVSSGIAGFIVSTDVTVGAYTTTFTVITPAPAADPILGQWYSSPNMVQTIGSTQYKYATKFDGLPIGSMMPVFKDATETDNWGKLDGKADSKYPGWIYCDGSYISPSDYPALYSVIGTLYGANIGGDFRLPDMRNKKVMGTGPVDGNASSSPALVPDYGPAKNSNNKSNTIPGSHGGLWYIDQIGIPGNQSIPQVETAGVGLTPVESDYFSIAQITTSGYPNITGQIEFTTQGQVSGSVSMKPAKQFEVPFHQHLLLAGQPDNAYFKGKVQWLGNGGISSRYQTESFFGQSPTLATTNVQINLWGYALTNITLQGGSDGDTIETTNSPNDTVDDAWLENPNGIEYWDASSGYNGPHITKTRSSVSLRFPDINSGSANYNEINSYINLATEPFSGAAAGGDEYKFVASIDIPKRTVGISSFTPTIKYDHSHYLTLTQLTASNSIFSYGNANNQGTAYSTTPSTTSVSVVFTAAEIGLEVLPGRFTLNSNKQLIPTPSLAPQDKVPLITPYTWVKWLIKAY